MHEFIHHPDGLINIQGTMFPMDFWQIVEPRYALPDGYIGRLFAAGAAHQLIRVGNNTHDQADINDAVLTGYVYRKDDYVTAYAAWQGGAVVANVDGQLVISGPPALSVDKAQIANDGLATVTITCDLGDVAATDEMRWSVTAPDGSLINEADNAIGGVDSWQLTTSHIGYHTVRVETDNFGSAQIVFEGV